MADRDQAGAAGGAICPGCGRSFVCGMAAGDQVCWCARLPPLAETPDAALGCLCPDCLNKRLANSTPGQA